MICKERSGFLALNQCNQCHKPICQEHARMDSGMTLCVSCQRRVESQQPSSARPRHNDPYWYTHHHYDDYHYYDDRDHRVFDPQAQPEGPESDFDAS
jgi:hypothetical protein